MKTDYLEGFMVGLGVGFMLAYLLHPDIGTTTDQLRGGSESRNGGAKSLSLAAAANRSWDQKRLRAGA